MIFYYKCQRWEHIITILINYSIFALEVKLVLFLFFPILIMIDKIILRGQTMKKIIYIAPALLLGLIGKGAMADQTTHISRLDEGFMTSLSESQTDQTVNAHKLEQEQAVQNKDVKTGEAKKTTSIRISSLDSGIIEGNAKTNETNEIRHTAATNVNSLDNNTVENNTKAVQYSSFSVKANTKTAADFAESKVTNGDSNQHTIRNPNRDRIIIHYVDENGKTIAGLKDYKIDIDNAPNGNSTGQFKVPDNRYVLPDPTSNYKLQHDKHTIHHDAVTHTVYHGATGHYEDRQVQNGFDWSNPSGTDIYGNHVDAGSGWVDIPEDHNAFKPAAHDITTYYYPHYDTVSTWVEDSPGYDETIVDKPAYDETVGNNVFSDNSKNIKSVIGNTVNVILKHNTRQVDLSHSNMEFDSWRKVHVINSDNQSNLTNKSVKFKVSYVLDLVSLAKTANFNSSQALSDPNDFIGENKLTDPVGFSTINTKLLSISL